VATMVRTIFAQPDAETVHEQHRRIVDQLAARFPHAAGLLEEARARPARPHRLPQGALAAAVEQ
jgi:Transposase, Mutator family